MNADLQRLLIENLHLDPGDLSPETRLEDAGLDSLAIAELGLLLSDRGLPIPDEQWSTLVTMADLDAMVGARLTGGRTL